MTGIPLFVVKNNENELQSTGSTGQDHTTSFEVDGARVRIPPILNAFDGDVSVRRWEDVRERFEDSPKTPEIQDMGSYRDSEKA